MKINSTEFNIEFCKQFPAERLRKIYSGEDSDTLDKLIEAIYPSEVPEVPEKIKTSKKK